MSRRNLRKRLAKKEVQTQVREKEEAMQHGQKMQDVHEEMQKNSDDRAIMRKKVYQPAMKSAQEKGQKMQGVHEELKEEAPRRLHAQKMRGVHKELHVRKKIEELSNALLTLQKNVPALADWSKDMAHVLAEFKVSNQDQAAYSEFHKKCTQLIEKGASVKDPLLQRVWHDVVTTIKAFLSYLDCMQAKITGSKIDQPKREHLFKTPALPVEEAKKTFTEAFNKMHESLEPLIKQHPTLK